MDSGFRIVLSNLVEFTFPFVPIFTLSESPSTTLLWESESIKYHVLDENARKKKTQNSSAPSKMSLEDFLTFRAPPRPTLPNDFTLLLTDTLESPSTFLLTYFIARELRSEFEKRRVVLIGLGEGVEGYTSLLRKNVSLSVTE